MTKPTANQPKGALGVEDKLDLLKTLKAAPVEEADFRVLTAAVPDLVVPEVEAAPPDVVVLDIALPGRSGWEVLAAPTPAPRFRTMPVLIVSALPEAQAQVAQFHDPWVEFLAKPVDLERLLKQVQAVVERHQQATVHDLHLTPHEHHVPAPRAGTIWLGQRRWRVASPALGLVMWQQALARRIQGFVAGWHSRGQRVHASLNGDQDPAPTPQLSQFGMEAAIFRKQGLGAPLHLHQRHCDAL